jgi:hypothetical protein
LCDGVFSILLKRVMSKKLLCSESIFQGLILNAPYKLDENFLDQGTLLLSL